MVGAANPIPDEEHLFRSISTNDVDPDGLVLESAVDLEGTSVDRASFIPDISQLAPKGGGNTGLAVTTEGALPKNVSCPPSPVVFDSFAWHEPTVGNDAHSEIRAPRKIEKCLT
jgi:hypothetical protein